MRNSLVQQVQRLRPVTGSDPATASGTATAQDGSGGLWLSTGDGLDHLDAHGVIERTPIEGLPKGGITAVLMAATRRL